ncbi:MAG: hypothetical protein E7218_03675 [Anaerofustis stercorihominis]|nr:hypothetical protein [Anaerofustis stercorihominis]
MRLSMWMIANRLSALDPEIHIRDSAPITLRSARRAYATNCVHVYQEGNDIICNGEGDYIKLKDMGTEQAFELVQYIFDFYDDWAAGVRQAAEEMDYQRIVDECWHVFHNPIVFLDANCKVLAMSGEYAEDEIDSEWQYLSRYGYSSVVAVSSYANSGPQDGQSAKPYVFHAQSPDQIDCLSIPLVHENANCGRINVLQFGRKLNLGDMQLLGYLADIITSTLGALTPSDEHTSTRNVFYDLLIGQNVAKDTLDFQMQYMHWDKEDPLYVVTLVPKDESLPTELLSLVSSLLSKQIPGAVVLVIDRSVIVVYNEKHTPKEQFMNVIRHIVKQNGLYMGISLPVFSVYSLDMFYKQAVSAIEYGKLFRDKKDGEDIFSFYDYAIDYIIENSGTENLLYVCHPDILSIYMSDNEASSDRMTTLRSYLNNERSLVNTAQELYVHRNTLVYRIKKITDSMKYDINDVYTRDYMKISIKLIDLASSRGGIASFMRKK